MAHRQGIVLFLLCFLSQPVTSQVRFSSPRMTPPIRVSPISPGMSSPNWNFRIDPPSSMDFEFPIDTLRANIVVESPHLFKTAIVRRRTNLRRDASNIKPPLAKLKPFETVFLGSECSHGFCKIRSQNGLIGWVWKRNLYDDYLIEGYSPDTATLSRLDSIRVDGYFQAGANGEHLLYSHDPRMVLVRKLPPRQQEDLRSLQESAARWNTLEAKVIQKVVDELPLGKVIYSHPSEMNIFEPYTIKIRISKDLKAEIQKSLNAEGVVQEDTLKIATHMKASLSGSSFDIQKLSDEEQSVSPQADWAFQVTPLQTGKQTLRFLFTIKIASSWGAETPRDYPIEERTVVVHVAPLNQAKHFVIAHWQWICTTLVIPIATWIWNSKRKKHRKKSSKKIDKPNSVKDKTAETQS